MRTFFVHILLVSLVLLANTSFIYGQAPIITSPANNATGISLTPTITFTSNSTGNSSGSPDNLLIEISKDASFNHAQASPDYQRFFWFQKVTNDLRSYSWTVPTNLTTNTVYYIRAYSSKNGNSSIVSFTTNTSSQAPLITVPSNGATGIQIQPTITFTSSSTGNSSASPDNLKIEISQAASFSSSQASPAYQSFYWYQKTTDGLSTYNWSVPTTLALNTLYYIRLYSTKNGYSSVFSFTTSSSSQAPVITVPSNGATGIQIQPTITFTSSSTGNSSASPDNLKIEISQAASFSSSQASPAYQSFYWYSKTTDGLSTYNWSVPATLALNTLYYIRLYSTKNGYSSVFSFTTSSSSQAPVITVPSNGATGIQIRPTITFTSSSTGNSSASPDNLKIEISQAASFSSSQASPAYQSFYWYSKTTDGLSTYNWNVPTTLALNTLYYIRLYSTKNGYSSVFSFTTSSSSQAPVITVPSDGATGIQIQPTITFTSSSTGNSSASPDNLKIEISQAASFSSSQASPAYQSFYWYSKTTDGLSTYNWNVPTALTYNTVYYARAYSSKNDYSTVISFTTQQPDAPVLTLVDGISAVNNNQYANKRTTPLTATLISGAEQYNWEFDIEGDFTSVEYTTSSATNVLNLDAISLNSGQSYWVRVQAVNNSIPFQSTMTSSTPYMFYNALHPIELYAPTTTSSNYAPKLWTTNVANGTDFIFQVDNDADFSSPFSNVCTRTWANTTHSGVTGNVFKANKDWYAVTGWTPSANSITHKVFESPACLPDATYYVRVLASNTHQTGYWDNVKTFTVSGGGYRISANNGTEESSPISIHPNPAQNYITVNITSSDEEKTEVILYNASGKEITKFNVLNNVESKIDISSLERGVYFAKIVSNNEVKSEKIVLY